MFLLSICGQAGLSTRQKISVRIHMGGGSMKLPSEAEVLRIFIGESDRYDGKLLYEAIVTEARKRDMAGATVFKGALGFGVHSRIHTANIFALSEDLPVVVEIVDNPESIEAFLPDLDKMVGEGLITIEKVRVIAYRHSDEG